MTAYTRFANPDDAQEIAKVHIASWQTAYRGLLPDADLDALSIDQRAKDWKDLLDKNIKILLVVNDNQIVGFASIGPSRDADADKIQCGEISAIYLHPAVWRQGLGRQLLTAAVVELKKAGFKEITVWVVKDNQHARKFYEAMGFVEVGKLKQEEFINGITLIEMKYKMVLG